MIFNPPLLNGRFSGSHISADSGFCPVKLGVIILEIDVSLFSKAFVRLGS